MLGLLQLTGGMASGFVSSTTQATPPNESCFARHHCKHLSCNCLRLRSLWSSFERVMLFSTFSLSRRLLRSAHFLEVAASHVAGRARQALAVDRFRRLLARAANVFGHLARLARPLEALAGDVIDHIES